MAKQQKDWKQEWLAIQKENRKLAKRANQRLVRLERAAKKPGMKSILEYAYKAAMRDIKSTGKQGKQRFRENVKLVDIFSDGKLLTGQALYKQNVLKQRNINKMLKQFLQSQTSTIGKGRSGKAEGLTESIGIKSVMDKRTQTINERFLSDYDVQMSDNDLKRFFESKKQAKLEKEVGSAQMFAVAAVMKKYNLKSNKRDFEKFIKSHIDLTEVSKEDVSARKGENFSEYLDRVSEFAKYTDDEVLNDFINKALKSGLNVNNIFI